MFMFLSFLSLLILGTSRSVHIDDIREFSDRDMLFDGRNGTSNYDITEWVKQLHLQHCAFVEIGEGFCAIFVELRDLPSTPNDTHETVVREFFIGLCTCAIIRTWSLCSDELMKRRESDCIFTEATPYSSTTSRVHRRLCDVALLSRNASSCNCATSIANQKLYAVQGFPTCFMNPLPESLCYPRGVCGIAQCSTVTINGIHSPICDPNCRLRQPFCEEVDSWSSVPPEINSRWSDWSTSECNTTCGEGTRVTAATCQDQVTGEAAIDCLGPGSFCSSDSVGKCYWEVKILDGVMRASGFTGACISAEGCMSTDSETFTFEGVLEPRNSIDSDELYDTDDRERFEESSGPSRRLLRASYIGNSKRERRRLKRHSALHDFHRDARLEDDSDYDDDEDDEGDINNDSEANEEEVEDEVGEDTNEDEETMKSSLRGRRNSRKRVPKSDYEASYEDEEPEKKESTEGEECEDGSTESPQYYDYDASASASQCRGSMELTMVVTVNILIIFAGC